MKKRLLATIVTIFPAVCFAGDFKIKEYEIGLPIESYKFAYLCKPSTLGVISCLDPAPGFTIGGENVKNAFIKFNADEKLDMMVFSFDPTGFESIKAAILGKYKSVRCSKTAIENAFGAKFLNEICVGKTKNETMSLDKYSGTIKEGSLTIVSNAQLEKEIKQKMEKSKDI